MTTTTAVKHAPSSPLPEDEWDPTNPGLWGRCIDLAKGDLKELRDGDRTIQSPNNGAGFRPWPHPNGTAWAVKQYNSMNGGWTRKTAAWKVPLLEGFVVADEATALGGALASLPARELTKVGSDSRGNCVWEVTPTGRMLIAAELQRELSNWMADILAVLEDPSWPETFKTDLTAGSDMSLEAGRLQAWLNKSFRLHGTSTPKGGKSAKEALLELEKAINYIRIFFASDGGVTPEGVTFFSGRVRTAWNEAQPQLSDIERMFGNVDQKDQDRSEITVNGVRMINKVGLSAATFDKFVKKTVAAISQLTGWQAKVKSNLTIVFAPAKDFRSANVWGVYKRGLNTLFIRATPDVLKKHSSGGLGSFDHVVLHELGHHYENTHKTIDCDRVEWKTTSYSRTEGEAFAELFALSILKFTGSWDNAIVEEFDRRMSAL